MPDPTPDDPTQWQSRAESAERELAVRRAMTGIDWFDPDDAYRDLASRAERTESGDWRIQVPDAAGTPQPVPIADAARDLAARKPHWVKARALGGSGAAGGTPGVATVTYADLLKPENAAKLRQFIHERPEDLERLRQSHFAR